MIKSKTPLQQEFMLEVYDLMERLYVIQAAMELPKNIKAGVYKSGELQRKSGKNWLVLNPPVASMFEQGTVGFAPAPDPVELKSFKEWNKAQMEKKCHTI